MKYCSRLSQVIDYDDSSFLLQLFVCLKVNSCPIFGFPSLTLCLCCLPAALNVPSFHLMISWFHFCLPETPSWAPAPWFWLSLVPVAGAINSPLDFPSPSPWKFPLLLEALLPGISSSLLLAVRVTPSPWWTTSSSGKYTELTER